MQGAQQCCTNSSWLSICHIEDVTDQAGSQRCMAWLINIRHHTVCVGRCEVINEVETGDGSAAASLPLCCCSCHTRVKHPVRPVWTSDECPHQKIRRMRRLGFQSEGQPVGLRPMSPRKRRREYNTTKCLPHFHANTGAGASAAGKQAFCPPATPWPVSTLSCAVCRRNRVQDGQCVCSWC
jgi:hypothetical protein